MNNEIKEILDEMKFMQKKKVKFYSLDIYQSKLLLDYITNLQEENEKLKEDITAMNDYIGKIQKENNILKENAEHNDKVVDKAKWDEMIYKSRIDKAIEITKTYSNMLDTKGVLLYSNLLNALQGSDK